MTCWRGPTAGRPRRRVVQGHGARPCLSSATGRVRTAAAARGLGAVGTLPPRIRLRREGHPGGPRRLRPLTPPPGEGGGAVSRTAVAVADKRPATSPFCVACGGSASEPAPVPHRGGGRAGATILLLTRSQRARPFCTPMHEGAAASAPVPVARPRRQCHGRRRSCCCGTTAVRRHEAGYAGRRHCCRWLAVQYPALVYPSLRGWWRRRLSRGVAAEGVAGPFPLVTAARAVPASSAVTLQAPVAGCALRIRCVRTPQTEEGRAGGAVRPVAASSELWRRLPQTRGALPPRVLAGAISRGSHGCFSGRRAPPFSPRTGPSSSGPSRVPGVPASASHRAVPSGARWARWALRFESRCPVWGGSPATGRRAERLC